MAMTSEEARGIRKRATALLAEHKARLSYSGLSSNSQREVMDAVVSVVLGWHGIAHVMGQMVCATDRERAHVVATGLLRELFEMMTDEQGRRQS